jgi:hypothetical protein
MAARSAERAPRGVPPPETGEDGSVSAAYGLLVLPHGADAELVVHPVVGSFT